MDFGRCSRNQMKGEDKVEPEPCGEQSKGEDEVAVASGEGRRLAAIRCGDCVPPVLG